MKWWRLLSFIHESRFIGLFSLLWSAMTPHAVCDTNISMTCFHKLTFIVFNSSYERYGDCWATSKPVLAVRRQIDPHHLLILSILSKYYNWMWKIGKALFVQYPVIKQLIDIVKNMIIDNLSILEKLTKLGLQLRKTKKLFE